MNCPISSQPFEFATYPLRLYFGDFLFPIVWAIILGIIYLRSHNPMLTSIVGLLIASVMTTASLSNSVVSGLFDKAYVLVVLAMGTTLYFMLKTKINNPEV